MYQARIALDAMGGDRAPQATVRGALEALAIDADGALTVLLVGREEAIKQEIADSEHQDVAAKALESGLLKIVHAEQVVGSGDAPRAALRMRDSSILRCAQLVQAGEADGLVAAGNTGAAVGAATIVIKSLPGVRRPGIAVNLPTATGQTVLCDAGANIHCKPLHLYHYGIMASQYCHLTFDRERPTVGLLNVGSEEGKGTGLVRETAQLFESSGLNFIGNVEGNDVFNGRCDVIVCEGFVGNVVLKTSEGLYEVISSGLRDLAKAAMGVGELTAKAAGDAPASSPMTEALGRFKSKMDWAEHGGAPLLGVNGLVLISHGRSDSRAIRNALSQAATLHGKRVINAMSKDLQTEASRSAS